LKKKTKFEKEMDRIDRMEKLPLRIAVTALIISVISLLLKILPNLPMQ